MAAAVSSSRFTIWYVFFTAVVSFEIDSIERDPPPPLNLQLKPGHPLGLMQDSEPRAYVKHTGGRSISLSGFESGVRFEASEGLTMAIHTRQQQDPAVEGLIPALLAVHLCTVQVYVLSHKSTDTLSVLV